MPMHIVYCALLVYSLEHKLGWSKEPRSCPLANQRTTPLQPLPPRVLKFSVTDASSVTIAVICKPFSLMLSEIDKINERLFRL